MPIALVATILLVTVAVTLVQTVAMTTVQDLGRSTTPLADAAMAFMGGGGAALIGIGSAVSMGGHNAGSLMFAPRMLFALAEHGDMPRAFGHVHRAWRTPDVAICFTSAVTLGLAFSGSFALLAAGSAVTRLLTYTGVSAATLVLRDPRRTAAAPPAAFVVPFGAAVPAISIVLSLAIVLAASASQWLFGAGALTVGTLMYLARPGGARF